MESRGMEWKPNCNGTLDDEVYLMEDVYERSMNRENKKKMCVERRVLHYTLFQLRFLVLEKK